MRSSISCAISGVYLLGLPVFFGASGAFAGVSGPLAFTSNLEAAVRRFNGFLAVSGMTLVLVFVDEAMVTESLIRRLALGMLFRVRGIALSLRLR